MGGGSQEIEGMNAAGWPRGENAEYVGITKDGVAFLERPVNDSGCRRRLRIL